MLNNQILELRVFFLSKKLKKGSKILILCKKRVEVGLLNYFCPKKEIVIEQLDIYDE
jgi:hypothetical protein